MLLPLYFKDKKGNIHYFVGGRNTVVKRNTCKNTFQARFQVYEEVIYIYRVSRRCSLSSHVSVTYY